MALKDLPGFAGFVLRLQEIGLFEEDVGYFVAIDEFFDVDGFAFLDVGAFEVFIVQDDVGFVLFVAFDDVFPGYFFACFFVDALEAYA